MKALRKRSSMMVTALVIVAVVTIAVSQWASAGSASPDEVISQAVTGLAERGVPVEFWSLEGPKLTMALGSESRTAVGTPDDPINLSLAQREAFLAKSRGVDLDSFKVEVTNANQETLFVGEIVLDRELDPTWSKTEAPAEAETLDAVRTALSTNADLSGLRVEPITLTSKDGAREIHLRAVAADAKSAGVSTASLMINLYNAVNDANELKNGQIALAFVDIVDRAGEPLLRWVYDAQRGTQDWWQAPDMTTDWFPSPGAAAKAAEAQER